MQLADVIRSIRRHWKVSASLMAASVLVLAIFLVTRNEVLPETEYQASVQVLIPAPDDKGIRPEGVPPVLLQGQISLASGSSTREAAFDIAGLKPDERQQVRFAASQSATLDIMTLSARAGSPDLASKAANGLAAAYTDARSSTVGSRARSRQQSLRTGVAVYRDRLTAIEADLRSRSVSLPQAPPADSKGTVTPTIPDDVSEDVALLLSQRLALRTAIAGAQQDYASSEIQALTPTSYASIVERLPAQRLTPPAPSPVVPAAVALGVGLLLALGVPTLMDRLDHTVRDAKTAVSVFDAPLLTTLPPLHANDRRYLAAVGSDQDQAYRLLAARSIATDQLPRAIVVTAPRGHVQDAVAANFANALADLGLKVVLVATSTSQQWYLAGGEDRIKATLPELLEEAHRGITPGDVSRLLTPSDSPNLFLIPAGDFGEHVASLDGLPTLLSTLESSGIDVVIIAAPPLLDDPAATIFAWTTRSVLWTIESGATTQVDAQEAAGRIDLAGVTPFGITMAGAQT